jgi:hypothetical protein
MSRRHTALLTAVLATTVLATTVLTTAGAAVGPVAAAETTRSGVVRGHVLIYGPSLAPGAAFNEATVARSLGYNVAIADSIAWNALERADFARYDAVIIGDRGCTEDGPGYLGLAAATRGRWTPALTGNVSVVASDPVFHVRSGNLAGARRLVRNGLQLATAASGTGAYLSLGCAYAFAPTFTTVPVLRGFGPFTVRGQTAPPFNGCPDTVRVVRPLNPLVKDLTGAALSGWGCSIHAGVDAYPFPFKVVAEDALTSLPYLLVRPPTAVTASERVSVYSAPSSIPTAPRVSVASPNAG